LLVQGKAHRKLGNFDDSVADLDKALKMIQVKKVHVELKEEVAEELKKSKIASAGNHYRTLGM
jgi:hypothetical protein